MHACLDAIKPQFYPVNIFVRLTEGERPSIIVASVFSPQKARVCTEIFLKVQQLFMRGLGISMQEMF